MSAAATAGAVRTCADILCGDTVEVGLFEAALMLVDAPYCSVKALAIGSQGGLGRPAPGADADVADGAVTCRAPQAGLR